MKNLESFTSLCKEDLIKIEGGALPYSPPTYALGIIHAIGDFASGFVDRFTLFSK